MLRLTACQISRGWSYKILSWLKHVPFLAGRLAEKLTPSQRASLQLAQLSFVFQAYPAARRRRTCSHAGFTLRVWHRTAARRRLLLSQLCCWSPGISLDDRPSPPDRRRRYCSPQFLDQRVLALHPRSGRSERIRCRLSSPGLFRELRNPKSEPSKSIIIRGVRY